MKEYGGGAEYRYTFMHSKGGSSRMVIADELATVNSQDEPNSFTFFVSVEQERAIKMEETELILGASVLFVFD